MTAKRFHKLFRSEMTKLMAHHFGAAFCIKAASRIRPFGPESTIDSTIHSYQEVWDIVREDFLTEDNIPPVK